MDFKEFILKIYSAVAYYGKPSNECFLTTEGQFEDALSLEQKGWLTFWLSTESCKRLSPASESTPRTVLLLEDSAGTGDTVSDKRERQLQRLKEKHPRVPDFKLRVWAQMLVSLFVWIARQIWRTVSKFSCHWANAGWRVTAHLIWFKFGVNIEFLNTFWGDLQLRCDPQYSSGLVCNMQNATSNKT